MLVVLACVRRFGAFFAEDAELFWLKELGWNDTFGWGDSMGVLV